MKIRACVGKGYARVYKTEKFLRRKIGKLDIDLEESMPSKEDWQEMLKGTKPGDKFKIIYAIIR